MKSNPYSLELEAYLKWGIPNTTFTLTYYWENKDKMCEFTSFNEVISKTGYNDVFILALSSSLACCNLSMHLCPHIQNVVWKKYH